MRWIAFAVALVMSVFPGSAKAQDFTRACLQAGSSSDATFFCLKASVLLQRAQLQRLDDLRAAIDRLSERTIAAMNLNGARTTQVLEPLGEIARGGGYLFVDDLASLEGNLFECPTGDCATDAQAAAAKICQQLKFAAPYSFDFKENDEGGPMMRMQWLVCRR